MLAATADTESGFLVGLGNEKTFEEFGVYIEFIRHPEDTFDDNSLNIGAVFNF